MTTALPAALTPLPTGPQDRKTWAALAGAGMGLAIAEAVRQWQGPVLLVTSDSQRAARLEEEVRFFSGDSLPVQHFPDWETLPYDQLSPHQDIISDRLRVLAGMTTLQRGLVITSISTLAQRLAPASWLAAQSFSLKRGQRFDLDQTRQQLEAVGYHAVETVYEHGEYAVRGSLMDIFPMGASAPVRIELFDDEIESLRLFSPDTQRTTESIDRLELLPAREYPFDKSAIRRFKDQWADSFDSEPKQCPVYRDVSSGLASAGIEYYLPLFFESTAGLLDYLPANALLVMESTVPGQLAHFWQEIGNRYEERRHDRIMPILPPDRLFLRENELFAAINRFARLNLNALAESEKPGMTNLPFAEPPALPVDARSDQPLAALSAYLATQPRVLLCAESAGRRENLLELLKPLAQKPQMVSGWNEFAGSDLPFALTVAPLEHGLCLPGLVVIAESQLFGQRVLQRRRRKAVNGEAAAELAIRSLSELTPGSPVVHIDHGVGRYHGLVTLDMDGETQEFLLLEYANNAKLYVPVASLHLIARYTGADDAHAPLHRLGTENWAREKRKAAEQIHDVAAELLNISARRAARPGYAFKVEEQEYARFAAGFPFEETADQSNAILSTITDMRAPRPMDRLVCGDVGFGKTEVAMRAAFVAIQDGKQVAVLVPTTLLAQQHYENFRDRFADWPVRIEVLSRFRTAKEQQAALDSLEEGKIDIIIGTHKLLQDSVQFKRLGLMIVDEEHRFGVRHKEALKNRRAEVDMLTLTATPIPRTLNMALSGLRDLSIIATPPAKRLAVKTFVHEHTPAIVKEAILRELLRGGQAYYLHNDVATIEKCAADLQGLIPEARIGIAHGQMRERELEQVMQQFYHKQFNVLVCSTIIETGIDIPSANTILMERADKLGLAQLHQLRGRVGRSHHQAYAYLLTPHKKAMTPDAEKRLEAIQRAGELGAGFALASEDLEIRGAGELLGEEQSGNVHAVGFTLYMEMLERAVKAIKAGKTPNLDQPLELTAEVNLRISALIPDDYLPDVHNRLLMYKRISHAETADAMDELQIEMIDRFGLLPEPTKNLFNAHRLKLQAAALGIRKIDAGPQGGRLEFAKDTKVQPVTIIKLLQSQPAQFRMDGGDKLKFSANLTEPEKRLAYVAELLKKLGG
ncbi:transcription-repair coupling factor [Fluviicoccus keumensis]|uniref:Transcription-repair-coupling factor n=1 Tax=Fluviicoccus keumensis TaxID=1435465 RepID=A0A4Q7Z4W7_9GAMM|nr:transcription-repair coupling factor [Fluviicoccus keumensis]RZU45044.1 transcription-repair coupling factor [Fluviicoccus keumensis]